jgi:hypothetical protein
MQSGIDYLHLVVTRLIGGRSAVLDAEAPAGHLPVSRGNVKRSHPVEGTPGRRFRDIPRMRLGGTPVDGPSAHDPSL